MWTYKQSTGELRHDDKLIATGYSGSPAAKNNPAMQNIHKVGPIPQGFYTIAPAYHEPYEGKMPPVMHLIPNATNQMFGRDGFLIHGDSIHAPGTASEGCIIMAHDIRVLVDQSPDRRLQVVA